MAADWYCEIDGETHGPMTADQLKQLATDGKLQPAHPVWKEGMQKTVPARSVKGLFDSAAATAAALAEVSKRPPAANALIPAPKKEEDLIEFEMVGEVDEIEEVEELAELEVIEPEPSPKKSARPDKEEEQEAELVEDEPEPEPELLAEIEVTYRAGLPDLDGETVGKLCVETTGLRFLFEDGDEEEEYPISFKKIENVMEPCKGDFPKAMKRKALAKNLGGKAGKLAAGLLGKWMGGDAGKLVGKVGGAAGDLTAGSGNLGKPPRNRITVVARLRKQRCKIYFDVHGADGFEMTQEAKLLFKQIQKARDKFTRTEAEGGEANINIVVNHVGAEENETSTRETPVRGLPFKEAAVRGGGGALAALPPMTGKPFRVMSDGRIRGPFSLEELRTLVGSGKLGDADLIGVETWLPLATLGGLVAAGGGAIARGGSEAAAEDEEVEVFEGDYEEVEDDSDAEEQVPVSKTEDGDSIPMDDEFQIG